MAHTSPDIRPDIGADIGPDVPSPELPVTNDTSDAAESPVALVPAPTIRQDGWTIEKQLGFLRMLASTQSVSAAAKAVGMSRQSAYKLRARLNDAPFGAGWRLAMRNARNVLVEAALDRAINGVEVPHYWQGELVGTSRRFDERLTTALLNSGALKSDAHSPNGAEYEYAQMDLSRLLDRIENGPAEWSDLSDERDFVHGEYEGDEGDDLDQGVDFTSDEQGTSQ